ncbi:cation transporter [Marivibrio halodurans]|uniref:Cation transporter n=1 Tax=Marivibrio halodurans TaxID=2039722 RepID=A0A8J7RVH2_9PROT|nr:cation diffusion facilitator family transporter [Marivibrio halodurans]MBP5855452.1 cation transporter [Marivibrio halodurans]
MPHEGHAHGHHDHQHHHHHVDPDAMGDRKLHLAVAANIVLTVGQVAGGLAAGSLALVADALHNFSDAAALLLAVVARRIGRKPADPARSFGYRRAELIAALINLTVLVVLGLFLVNEAVWRLIEPEPIEGWIVVIVAGVALAVDVATACLTFALARTSINIKAAFVHNLADAAASLAVILGGGLILLFGWVWIDAVLTLAIAVYVLWHGLALMPGTIHILMEGTPRHIDRRAVIDAMAAVSGVEAVHHIHIWWLDEARVALEAHVVIDDAMVAGGDLARLEAIKADLKHLLAERFDIAHSTLEFERHGIACA